MTPLLFSRRSFAVYLCLVWLRFGEATSAGTVDFSRDIEPLLKQHCLECHNPEKQKSGLSLLSRENALSGGDSGKPSIVPGKPEESLLLQRVTTRDEDEVMPPKGPRLTSAQAKLLETWIRDGAQWPAQTTQTAKVHWAFVKPTAPALPKVERSNWPKNGIDHFVLARLEKEGLEPAAPADRETLLRRVYLDLIGLPPTPAQREKFLSDRSPEAYRKVVEELLASPHYGEKWARSWLDLARYADTQGYEKDSKRSMWPWRDWVIEALNSDMPFDQFSIEQIAGDMLPNATQKQKIATGFHRNTMTNTEGGTDNEEFRHEAVVDRVNTTFTVWKGTTFACAQCHNHKYDPFSMKEYYQVFAFLNNTADADLDDEQPVLKLPTPAQAKDLQSRSNKLADLRKALLRPEVHLGLRQAEWELKLLESGGKWQELREGHVSSRDGARLILSNGVIAVTGTNSTREAITLDLKVNQPMVRGLRIDFLPDPTATNLLGRGSSGEIILDAADFFLSKKSSGDLERLRFDRAVADLSSRNSSPTNLLSVSNSVAWVLESGRESARTRHSLHFFSDTGFSTEQGVIRIVLRQEKGSFGALPRLMKVYVTDKAQAELAPPVAGNIEALIVSRSGSAEEAEKKFNYFRQNSDLFGKLRSDIAATESGLKELDKQIPSTSIMAELEKQRKTHMHLRGSFLTKGDEVTAGVPKILHGWSEDLPRNRLGFARWLVSSNSPLVARVTMNRIWESYFGIGIVETGDDFGKQGEPPVNQELLDYLATQFVAAGWSQKAMHRLIVHSASYQQSSAVTPLKLEKDPYNRLASRGPRVRLDAEAIRDQALAVAGLLSPKVGGPSVMPPQPDGIWQVVYNSESWATSPGEDRYRRGLYTFWRRTSPYPSMVSFDAPSREFCVVRRARSNTPLQALILLNDPVYLEAAGGLVQRCFESTDRTDEQRLENLFRRVLVRPFQDGEKSRLLELLRTERERFRKSPEAAQGLLASANVPLDGKDQKEQIEQAAWTIVANVLLNLDEVITKN